MDEQTKYDKDTYDVSEIDNTDIRINPDYYIHHTLMKAQAALIKEDVKIGFLQFRMLVEHLEVLCKSANVIDRDYDEEVKEYLKSDEYLNAEDSIKDIKLANTKIRAITKEVFKSRLRTDPLTDKKE